MRRSALLLFTAILTGATGTALVAVSVLLVGSSQGAGPINASIAPTTAYVAAVNRVLQTGDPAALSSVVSADFVEHGPASAFGGNRSGLGRYLRALRATYPGIQVTFDEALANGERISVRLTFHGQRIETFLGAVLPSTSSTWTTLELFRIEAGKIAEHWVGDSGIELFQPLIWSDQDVGLTGADVIAIARVRPFGTVMIPITLPGAAVVVVEDGTVITRSDVSWPSVRPPNRMPVEIAPGENVALHSGDAAVLPAKTSELHLVDQRSSVIVVAAIPPQAASKTGPRDKIVDALLRHPGTGPGLTGGIAVERLALVNPRAATSDKLKIGLGRAVLPPGGSLDLDGIAGAAAVTVETGRIDVGPNDGRLFVQRTVHPGGEAPPIVIGEPVVLRDGDAAIVPTDHWTMLRNIGGGPAMLLIVTIASDGEPPLAAADHPAPASSAWDDPVRGPR